MFNRTRKLAAAYIGNRPIYTPPEEEPGEGFPPITIDWYVSTTGGTGAGTEGDPWSLAHARQGASGSIQPGDVVALRGGTYSGQFDFTVDGSVASPIKFINYPGEDVILDSGNASGGATVTLTGDYVWIQGGIQAGSLRITKSEAAPSDTNEVHGVTNNGAATGCKVINCIINNHTGNGLSIFSATDFEGYGNLCYFNGRAYLSANYAYGIYSQNTAPSTADFNDNICVHNFGNYPLHIYSGSSGKLENMRFRRNMTFYGWNLFGGADAFEDLLLHENVFYAAGPDNGMVDIGYYPFGNGTNNAVVTNNHFLDGKSAMHSTQTGMTCTGNTVYGRLEGWLQATYPSNTYYTAAWPSTPSAAPDILLHYPNEYEDGRSHIAVWNSSGATSVLVDLSGVLSEGDTYEVLDVQDVFGSPVASGTYSGGSVAVDLTSSSIESPISIPTGKGAPSHTSSEFNVFIVRKTG